MLSKHWSVQSSKQWTITKPNAGRRGTYQRILRSPSRGRRIYFFQTSRIMATFRFYFMSEPCCSICGVFSRYLCVLAHSHIQQPGLPDVLRNLTFTIHSGEKVVATKFIRLQLHTNVWNCSQVGILGRTGSGKTTLALTLFRFLEAKEGRILIDGTDIANIGLTDFRRKLTIIPRESALVLSMLHVVYILLVMGVEDPTIMSGTLRSALDAFQEYEDAEIASPIFWPTVTLFSNSPTSLTVWKLASGSFDHFWIWRSARSP